MLMNLRDVEVFIEPEEVLQQALEEGDISIDTVVRMCVDEEGADAVLEVINPDVVKQYCVDHDINIELNYYPQIVDAVKQFTTTEKAMLLWQLLKEEGV